MIVPGQAAGVGLEEVIRGSLSAELGSVLIGVVSRAGSPRPGSPARQGSVAHATPADAALQAEASTQQVGAQSTHMLPMSGVRPGRR